MIQHYFDNKNNYECLEQWACDNGITGLFVVCGSSLEYFLGIRDKLRELEQKGIRVTYFDDFKPNPKYESVVKGVALYRKSQSDGLLAVGGGSAIDVAKCIKLYSSSDSSGEDGRWLKEKVKAAPVPFMAIPTTAGTGSETTRYAVIYYNDEKQSITDDGIMPGSVLFNPDVLNSLPLYQRKSTMCDALCHAIESYWSINSNDESKEYSTKAIKGILEHMQGYLNNTPEGNEGMLRAANIAGKAINITQTTAGHAMSYKITSIFGIAHGHAAMLCNRVLFPWMIQNTDKCINVRGEEYLNKLFVEMAHAFGVEKIDDAVARFEEIFEALDFDIPAVSDEQLMELVHSVNAERFKNHPVKLDEDDLMQVYKQIFNIL